MWFWRLSEVSTEEENKWAEFQGHTDYPSNSDAPLNVKNSITTTDDQKTNIGDKHMAVPVATKDKEEEEKMHLFLVCPASKNE
jgi:hypothetical protein